MNIRFKLLLGFLSLTALVLVVSMIFYVQLRNLIEPLTPQSTPQNVERLANLLNRNDLINQLIQQEALTQRSLEHYVLANDNPFLEYYYVHDAMFHKLIDTTKKVYPTLWSELQKQAEVVESITTQIIYWMQHARPDMARQEIISSKYFDATQKTRNILYHYYQPVNTSSSQNAVVSVKVAAKKTATILQDTLNSTWVIFFDALIISILLAIFGARVISRPINMLRDNIEHTNVESLSVVINPELMAAKDEVGDLARSFSSLVIKLRATTVFRDELLAEVERRKQSEDQLHQTANRLEESNRELDQFAYIASHDLRAPLRAIENIAEWIQQDCADILPENSRTHLGLLKSRVRRLDSLISGILEYSRAGKIQTAPETICLNLLVSEIIESLLPPPNIEVVIDNHLPTIFDNRAAITQVFLNIINNAIKYCDKPEGHVHIGYEEMQKHYQFYISDNGVGIDSKFYDKIFEIFQTLQDKDSSDSTGIGLSIVKKIVSSQGGTIWLKSELGVGSTFYFTWPKSIVDKKTVS